MRTWLNGADTSRPYRPIFTALASILALARKCETGDAFFGCCVGVPAICEANTSCTKQSVPVIGNNLLGKLL